MCAHRQKLFSLAGASARVDVRESERERLVESNIDRRGLTSGGSSVRQRERARGRGVVRRGGGGEQKVKGRCAREGRRRIRSRAGARGRATIGVTGVVGTVGRRRGRVRAVPCVSVYICVRARSCMGVYIDVGHFTLGIGRGVSLSLFFPGIGNLSGEEFFFFSLAPGMSVFCRFSVLDELILRLI